MNVMSTNYKVMSLEVRLGPKRYFTFHDGKDWIQKVWQIFSLVLVSLQNFN